MSIWYYVTIDIYASFNEDTLTKIAQRALNLKLLSPNSVKNKSFFTIKPLILPREKDVNYASIDILFPTNIIESISCYAKGGGTMQLVFSVQTPAWEKKFLYPPKTWDTITPTKILLDLVSDFSIKNCFVDSDQHEGFRFSDKVGMFYAIGMNTGPDAKKCVTRDALHIIKSLEKIECAFLTDDCQPMNSVEVLSKIKSMLCMPVNDTDSIIIKTSAGYLVKAYFWGRHIKFWPLEPWCIKTTEYHTGIDVAHYIQILLAAMEPFNIYELATHCNDAFYE